MAALEIYNTVLYNDANLVSYWRFEADSADYKDSNTGTDNNISYSSGNGQFGQGAAFNGTNSKITLPSGGSSLNLNITGNFTLMAWVKTNTSTRETIIQNWNIPGNEYGWLFDIDSDGTVFLDIGNGASGSGSVRATSTGTVNDNAWHFVCATYDGTNSKIWIDGANDGSATPLSPTYDATRRTQIGIQNDTGTDLNPFVGSIDDVAVFDRALSSTEISDHFNGLDGLGSASISPSGSASASASGSISPSGSTSPSSSLSISPSASLSPSGSASPSSSVSPSTSPSGSASPSTSASPSASASMSLSPSTSISPSSSASRSLSPSGSASPSSSVSASLSPSASGSRSVSPSLSPSPSMSSSGSLSPSDSRSPSESISPSHSASSSASPSQSPSASPTSSPAYTVFSRAVRSSLPSDNSDLDTIYNTVEEGKVSKDDGVRQSITGVSPNYLIHQYKFQNDENKDWMEIRLNLQSSLSPHNNFVYLQVWNVNSSTWEDIDNDHRSLSGTDFDLRFDLKQNVANYYDTNNVVTIRVYQYNP